jgi:hypothetical protein
MRDPLSSNSALLCRTGSDRSFERLARGLIGAIESGARISQSGVEGRPGLRSRPGKILQLLLGGERISLHAQDGCIDLPPALDGELLRPRIELVRDFVPGLRLSGDLALKDAVLLLDILAERLEVLPQSLLTIRCPLSVRFRTFVARKADLLTWINEWSRGACWFPTCDWIGAKPPCT